MLRGGRGKKGREITTIAAPSGEQPQGANGKAYLAKRGGYTFVAKRLFDKVHETGALHEAKIECTVLELMSKSQGAVHFPTIVDVFVKGGWFYIVQEFCDLGDLDKFCRQKGPLTSLVASSVTWQTAAALHYLHVHNICHGDLKPDNIFLRVPQGRALPNERRRGGPPPVHAKLGDMGRAFAVIRESIHYIIVQIAGFVLIPGAGGGTRRPIPRTRTCHVIALVSRDLNLRLSRELGQRVAEPTLEGRCKNPRSAF